jgi:hypothetical protein
MKEARILGIENFYSMKDGAKEDLPRKEYERLEDMLEITNITVGLIMEQNSPYRAYAMCKGIGEFLSILETVDSEFTEHVRQNLIEALLNK